MTLPVQTTRINLLADGIQDTFPFDFLVLQESDLEVYENGTLTNRAYTVTGLGDVAGGTVLFSPFVPANGVTVTLFLNVPLDQETDYQPYDPFPAETHEAALDKLTQIAQQQQDELSRCLQFDVNSEVTGILLPTPLRNAILAWEDTVDPSKVVNGPTVSEVEQWKDDAEAAAAASAASASQSAASASQAATSATNAQNSEDAAELALNQFTNQYLGPKPTDPTLDNIGSPLNPGDLYWNTSVSEMRVYTGSAWISVYDPAAYLPLVGGTLSGDLIIEYDGQMPNLYPKMRIKDTTPSPGSDIVMYAADGFNGLSAQMENAARGQAYIEFDLNTDPNDPLAYIGLRNVAGAQLTNTRFKSDGNVEVTAGTVPVGADDLAPKSYVDGALGSGQVTYEVPNGADLDLLTSGMLGATTTIGPTGSTAAVIFTQLDSVPTDVDFIIFLVTASETYTDFAGSRSLLGSSIRIKGSAMAVKYDIRIIDWTLLLDPLDGANVSQGAAGNAAVRTNPTGERRIFTVTSTGFAGNFFTAGKIRVIGWGYNPA